jgi:single-stranded DNA-binding protein
MWTNRITFAGNAGKDAEDRTHGDWRVVSFTLCNTKRRGDKEVATWVNVKVFTKSDRQSFLASEALTVRKGDHVLVSGELIVTKSEGENGKVYTNVDIIADEVGFPVIRRSVERREDSIPPNEARALKASVARPARQQPPQQSYEPGLDDIPF